MEHPKNIWAVGAQASSRILYTAVHLTIKERNPKINGMDFTETKALMIKWYRDILIRQ